MCFVATTTIVDASSLVWLLYIRHSAIDSSLKFTKKASKTTKKSLAFFQMKDSPFAKSHSWKVLPIQFRQQLACFDTRTHTCTHTTTTVSLRHTRALHPARWMPIPQLLQIPFGMGLHPTLRQIPVGSIAGRCGRESYSQRFVRMALNGCVH